MCAASSIGHVHLKVSDVARAVAFYRDALGFAEQARMPGAAFLSAGGYHHHIGLNSWQSAGAQAGPENAPGLRVIEFELGSPTALEALRSTLAEARDGHPIADHTPAEVRVSDPDGNRLAFLTHTPNG
jgi:catechol 2,3-dioxygenase